MILVPEILIFKENLAFVKGESTELYNKAEILINISEKIAKHKERLATRLIFIFLLFFFFLGGLKGIQFSIQLLSLLPEKAFDVWTFLQGIFFGGLGCILIGFSGRFLYLAIVPLILTYGPNVESRNYKHLTHFGKITQGYIENITFHPPNSFTLTYKYKVGELMYYHTYSTSEHIQHSKVLVLYTDHMAILL
jgi:hypothetical protein